MLLNPTKAACPATSNKGLQTIKVAYANIRRLPTENAQRRQPIETSPMLTGLLAR